MKNLVPHFIIEKFEDKQWQGNIDAVAMFVDISGFTRLTEVLNQQGPRGSEELADILHLLYTPAVKIVYQYGGFIINFAGDAFTAIFPDLNTILAPLTAAYEIQKAFTTNRLIQRGDICYEFFCKIGLGAGDVSWEILESNQNRSYYFHGGAITQSARAEKYSRQNSIVADLSYFNLIRQQNPALAYRKIPAHYNLCFEIYLDEAPTGIQPNPYRPDLTRQQLLTFLPPAILDYPQQGEFRENTTVFVGLSDVSEIEAIYKQITILQQQYGGTFSRFLFGDKGPHFLMFWGMPQAYEDDLYHALKFIIELKNALAKLTSIRVGLTNGIHYTGFVGGEERQEFTCIGSSINLAARFMEQAHWGEIWSDQTTFQHGIQHFDIRPFGSYYSGQGYPHMPVYRVVREKKFTLEEFFAGPMIGRKREICLLRQKAAMIHDGQSGGAVIIYGEPGIGKSRLVYELEQETISYLNWINAQSDEISRTSLNPFKYWLKNRFDLSPDFSHEQARDHFNRQLNILINHLTDQEMAVELNRVRSILAALVDIFWKDSLYEELEPALRFENLRSAIISLILAETTLQPTILFIEDGHWLDSQSQRVLHQISTIAADYPLLIIVTSRYADDNTKPVFDCAANIPVEICELDYLDQDGIALLAQDQLGASVSQELVEIVYQRTSGNPFFAQQVIMNLQEQGSITLMNNGWDISGGLDQIPYSIRNVLIARYDRLPPTVKNLVQTASVLGREFNAEILNRMIQGVPTFQESLSIGEMQGIWTLSREVRYLFRHSLFCNVAYEMQVTKRRRALHKLAAEAYVTLYQDNPVSYYGEIAYHYERAGIADQTRYYLLKAAEWARQNFYNDQAVNYYQKLLNHYVSEPAEHVDILLEMTNVLVLTGDWTTARHNLETASRLARKINSTDRIARVQMARGELNFSTGNLNDARKLLENALDLFHRLNVSESVAHALGSLGLIEMQTGKYKQALHLMTQQLEISRTIADRAQMARAYGNMAVVHWSTGDYQAALKLLDKRMTICQEANQRHDLFLTILNIATIYLSQGKFEHAQKIYDEWAPLGQELGDKRSSAIVFNNLGIIYRNLGDLDHAREYYSRALKIHTELGDQKQVATTLGNLGALYERMGDLDQSLIQHQQAMAIYEKMGDRAALAIAQGNAAEIFYLRGEIQPALNLIQKAVSTQRELDLVNQLPASLLSHAEILGAHNQWPEAERLLQEYFERVEQSDQRVSSEAVIIESRIKFHLGHEEQARADLEGLLQSLLTEAEKAAIHYELWKFGRDHHHPDSRTNEHAQQAIRLFSALQESDPSWEYELRLKNLKSGLKNNELQQLE